MPFPIKIARLFKANFMSFVAIFFCRVFHAGKSTLANLRYLILKIFGFKKVMGQACVNWRVTMFQRQLGKFPHTKNGNLDVSFKFYFPIVYNQNQALSNIKNLLFELIINTSAILQSLPFFSNKIVLPQSI